MKNSTGLLRRSRRVVFFFCWSLSVTSCYCCLLVGLEWLILSLISTSASCLKVKSGQHPHSMMVLPPWVTMGMVLLGWFEVSFLYFFFFLLEHVSSCMYQKKKSMLSSTEQSFFLFVSCVLFVMDCKLDVLHFSFNNGFLFVTFP